MKKILMEKIININLLSAYYVLGKIARSNQTSKNLLSLTWGQGETICTMELMRTTEENKGFKK